MCSQYGSIAPQNIFIYILRLFKHSVSNICNSPMNLRSIDT